MSKKVKPIPDGYNTVTPYLIVKGAKEALEFYKKAFGATSVLAMNRPDGKIAHAEFRVGNSVIMMTEESPEMGTKSPLSLGGSPVSLHLYVEDVDSFFDRAVKAGATVIKPIENQFYGDRAGMVKDPFGHSWCISTHVEDLSVEEIYKRMPAMKK